jgi:hypothetical protein
MAFVRPTIRRSFWWRQLNVTTLNDSLLEGYIVEAERRFDVKRFPINICGIAESPSEGTHTQYDPERNNITVVLREPGSNDFYRRSMLAQESIHVFSPATPAEANALERGLATFFVLSVIENLEQPDGARSPEYLRDLLEVEEFVSNCRNGIKGLMEKKGRLCLIEAVDIFNLCPNLGWGKAEQLAKKIY